MRKVLITAAAASLLAPLTAAAGSILRPWENFHQDDGDLRFEPRFGLYSSSSNFDSSGSTFFPGEGLVSYTRVTTDLNVAWAVSPDWTVFGRGSWGWVTVTTQAAESQAFGLLDQAVGANFRLLDSKGGTTLDLQAQGEFPAYDNAQSLADATPFLGDASVDVTGGAFLTHPLSSGGRKARLKLVAGTGFTWRSQGYSMAVPWNLHLRYDAENKKLSLYGGSTGQFSLGTDSIGAITTCNRDPSSGAQATGGSCAAFAVNPTVINVSGGGEYHFLDRLAIFASADYPVLGANAPKGLSIAAGVRFTLSSDANATASGGADYSKPNRGFVTYSARSTVISVNDRLNMIKIDKGSQQGVVKGQVFDIFSVKKDGRLGEAVARATVTDVKLEQAVLKIDEYFREVWIEEGFIARRPLR